MNYNEVMAELESHGTEQNRKIYKRHGSGDNLFGVSFANLNKMKKKIKVDHSLATQLWDSGNTDAQSLATMIVDPSLMKKTDLEKWAKDVNYYLLADLLAGNIVIKTPHAASLMKKWTKSKQEYIGQSGWDILAQLAMQENELDDEFFKPYLETIEENIHQSKNRTKHAMNMALISIGIRNSKLQKLAVSAAKRIGKVDVDHGETSCKTPDAIQYIEKAVKRKKAKTK